MTYSHDDNKDDRGIVYAMTNAAMPGYIKIGKTGPTTENLLARKRDMSGTNVPVPFEVHYAVKVNEASNAEKLLLDAFAEQRQNSKREFLHGISPERVTSAMMLLLIKGEDAKEISLIEKDEDISDEDKAAQKAATKRQGRFNLGSYDINKGAELQFTRNPKIIVVVHSDYGVYFKDEVENGEPQEDDLYSVSGAANRAFEKIEKPNKWAVAGPLFWNYQGKTLDEIRNQKVEERENDKTE